MHYLCGSNIENLKDSTRDIRTVFDSLYLAIIVNLYLSNVDKKREYRGKQRFAVDFCRLNSTPRRSYCYFESLLSYRYFEPIKVETAKINWLESPTCLSEKLIYSPATLAEVKYLSSKYNLKRFIYTDFIRLNQTIFYRNV